MSDTVCFMCTGEFIVNNFVIVKRKGITAIINVSVVRNDGKDSVLQGLDSVKVHITCRKQYERIDYKKLDEINTIHRLFHPLRVSCDLPVLYLILN